MKIKEKFASCAVKKLPKINHENTKVRKHETRHKNQVNILRANFYKY